MHYKGKTYIIENHILTDIKCICTCTVDQDLSRVTVDELTCSFSSVGVMQARKLELIESLLI